MTTYRLSRSKCSSSQCSKWGKKKTSDQQHQQLNKLKTICSIYDSKCICKQGIPDCLSDLLNKPENKSNYTLCVIMPSVPFLHHYLALCIALSLYIWHCDAMTM